MEYLAWPESLKCKGKRQTGRLSYALQQYKKN